MNIVAQIKTLDLWIFYQTRKNRNVVIFELLSSKKSFNELNYNMSESCIRCITYVSA